MVLNVGDLFGAGFGASAIAAASADAASASLGDAVFGAFMSSTTEAIIYGLIFVVLTMLIVLGGVGGGIEKVCSVGMPALFVALLILSLIHIYSCPASRMHMVWAAVSTFVAR